MLTPPQHRSDATPEVVLEDDDAWDRPRIEDEREAMRKAKQDPERHPVAVYLSGETRYDLGAAIRKPDGTEGRAADYLDLAKAWRFVLKRIDYAAVLAAETLFARDFNTAGLTVARNCLVRVEGPNAPAVEHDKLGLVTHDCMQELFELKAELPVRLGVAGFQASMPLKPAEKKP
jgi:hypothetical protein